LGTHALQLHWVLAVDGALHKQKLLILPVRDPDLRTYAPQKHILNISVQGEHLPSLFSLLSACRRRNDTAFGTAEGAYAVGKASSGLDRDGFVNREAAVNHIGSLQTNCKEEDG
jgi:hypothetical protein